MTAMNRMPDLWGALDREFAAQFQSIPKPVAPGDFATPHDPRPDLAANVEATPVPWVAARKHIRDGVEVA